MSRLNSRQKDVLMLLTRGFHNAEIAHYLGLSERCIKSCVRDLLMIFEASNRTALAGLQITLNESTDTTRAGS